MKISTYYPNWRNSKQPSNWPRLCSTLCTRGHRRVDIFRRNLNITESETFLKRSITDDEIWIHHYKSKRKRQSMGWKHLQSSTRKMFSWKSAAHGFLGFPKANTGVLHQYSVMLSTKLKSANTTEESSFWDVGVSSV